MIRARYKINGYAHSEKWDIPDNVAKARAKALFELGECDYVYITKDKRRLVFMKRAKSSS